MNRMRIGAFKKVLIVYFSLLAISVVALMFPDSNLNAQVSIGADSEDRIGVIIHTAKPYGRVVDVIGAMGGVVTIQYQNADAVAARVPAGSIGRLHRHALVTGVEKDIIVEMPPIPEESLELRARLVNPAQAFESAGLSLKPGELPDRFPSYITQVTGAADVWPETGAGAGTIVAVIDSGTDASHYCLSGQGDVESPERRVIEGPDLSPDAGTEFEGSTRSTNGNHGTFVAGVIASNCFMVLDKREPADVELAGIFEAHLPPGTFFTSGHHILAPLVGIAPESTIYAVKVFPHSGGGAASSIIAAAVDHVITKKLQYQAGIPGGLDIDVVNMSLGGAAMFDGRTVGERLVDAATRSGIVVVVAAGNEGPAPVSVSSPGTAFTALTAGAASDPVHTRIFWDYYFGPGQGLAMYPTDEFRPADFSGRGPLADGRNGPDVLATGVFNHSLVIGGFTAFGSGTSYAAPGVAGGAALLSAWTKANNPELGPLAIRNAIMRGSISLSDDWKRRSQGSGYMNVSAALDALKSGAAGNVLTQVPPDEALPNVTLRNGEFSTSIDSLSPGRARDFVFEVTAGTGLVVIDLSDVTIDANPVPAVLLNSIEVYVKGAKRGGTPYAVYSANVYGRSRFIIGDGFIDLQGAISGAFLEEGALEPGLMKVTVQGDWTNNGNVEGTVTIRRFDNESTSEPGRRILPGEIILVPFEIPPGTNRASFDLGWLHNWTRFPTNDLDMFLCAPGHVLYRDFRGATLDSPEHLVVYNPTPGNWNVMVVGYGVFTPDDAYYLNMDIRAPDERIPPQPSTQWSGPQRLDQRHNPLGRSEEAFKGESCFR